jgi:hypothetical protein
LDVALSANQCAIKITVPCDFEARFLKSLIIKNDEDRDEGEISCHRLRYTLKC